MTNLDHPPAVVSAEEWMAARKELLAKEKELTRMRDRVNAERRRLPMVRVDKPYAFEGPDGTVGLLDLFEGRQQLVVYMAKRLARSGERTSRTRRLKVSGEGTSCRMSSAFCHRAGDGCAGGGQVCGRPRRFLTPDLPFGRCLPLGTAIPSATDLAKGEQRWTTGKGEWRASSRSGPPPKGVATQPSSKER